MPLHVKPAPAERVDDCVEQSELLSPSREAPQEDAIDLLPRIVDLLGEGGDLVPRRMERHPQSGLGEEILTIVGHAALCVKWHRIRLSSYGEGFHHGLQKVCTIIRGC